MVVATISSYRGSQKIQLRPPMSSADLDFLDRVEAAERRDDSRASSPLCSAKTSATSTCSSKSTSSKAGADGAKKKRSGATATGGSPAKPPAKRQVGKEGNAGTRAGGTPAKGGAASTSKAGGKVEAAAKEKGPARNINVKAEIKAFEPKAPCDLIYMDLKIVIKGERESHWGKKGKAKGKVPNLNIGPRSH